MTKPAGKPEVRELDADAAAADAERFLRDFHCRMAEQGLIVRPATAPPDWEPGITLDIPGDELSAMVVRLRGERARGILMGILDTVSSDPDEIAEPGQRGTDPDGASGGPAADA